MVFKRHVEGDISKVNNAKVAVYTCAVDIMQTETKVCGSRACMAYETSFVRHPPRKFFTCVAFVLVKLKVLFYRIFAEFARLFHPFFLKLFLKHLQSIFFFK